MQHVKNAVIQALPAPARDALTLEVRVLGARGAALGECPAGWLLPPVPAQAWQRLSIAVVCGTQAGSVVARIHAQVPVWTLRSDAAAGQRLKASDVVLAPHRIYGPADVLPLETITGQALRRSAKAGTALQPRDLERPVFARKGDAVEIRAHGDDGVTVSVAGIASKTGRMGEHARVRNTRSQQWVSGQWVAPGVLEAGALQPGAGSVRAEQELRD